jgi:hypothetical protein
MADDDFKWDKKGEVYMMCSSVDPKVAGILCIWTMFRQDSGGIMVQLNGIPFGRDKRGLLTAMQARVNRIASMMGHRPAVDTP